MAAMMLFAVSFVACNNDNVDEGNKKPTNVTFVISDVEATYSDVTYTVTPSTDDADYLVFVQEAATVEKCASDEELVAKLYADIEEYTTAEGTTLAAYLAEKVKRGKVENAQVKNLAYGTNYYILVFGVDARNNYAATTAVAQKRFATAEPELSDCTFTLSYSTCLTNISWKVTPSDNSQLWHLISLTDSDYKKYTSEDGEYGWTQQELFQNYLNTEVETLRAQGLTEEEINIKLFHKGARTLCDTGLAAKTKYFAMAAPVSIIDGNATLVSETIKRISANTGEAATSDLTFDIDIYNIDSYSADIKITPSDPEAEYYYYIDFVDSKKRDMKAIDLANTAILNSIYHWTETGEYKPYDPVKGVVDLTGENKYEFDIAETEYFVVAFSCEPNPNYGAIVDEETGETDTNVAIITSAPVYVAFKAPEHGDPMNADIQFNVTDCGPYDFSFNIVSADPTIYYRPVVAYANNFDADAVISVYASDLALIMQMCMEGQSPCLTYQEALEKIQAQGYPYRNGDAKFYVANMNPETSFVAAALAIDTKTGKYVKCYTSEVFSTTAVGSVNPTIEVLGLYDGKHENGTIFNDAAATANKAIVAVSHNNIEGATALFTSVAADAVSTLESWTDQRIISELYGYWSEVESLATPYYFFFCDWEVELTVVSYAQDANGAEGKVARKGVYTSGTANDIEELRGHVEAYNNAITAKAYKSLVVPTNDEPVLQCVWSEAVPAPRGAEVIYHEVEPLEVAPSDLVRVKVIKSFHI